MTMWGIIIGTGTVWLLSALIVMPLAQYLTSQGLKRQGVVISDTEALASDEEPLIALDYYIIADVLFWASPASSWALRSAGSSSASRSM
jgi:hypothetical protein